MKIFNKKIITTASLSSLIIFILGLIIPFNTFAQDPNPTLNQPLLVTAVDMDNNPVTSLNPTEPGDNSKIIAKVSTLTGGEVISFTVDKILNSINTTPCTPGTVCATCTIAPKTPPRPGILPFPTVESCSVIFKSSTVGQHKINVSMPSTSEAPLYPLPHSQNVYLNIGCKSPRTLIAGVCSDPVPIPVDTPAVNTDTDYKPLAGLPGLEKDKSFDTSQPCAFGKYMQIIFRLIIGISAVLAMVMIVYGGIEYMTSGAISEKENGKETITNAILGLLIALGAWLLLNTLNPQLLNVCFDMPEATIEISGDDYAQTFTSINAGQLRNMGIVCDESGGQAKLAQIAESFYSKRPIIAYNNVPRNTIRGSDQKYLLDCSSFVKQVYVCAGLNFTGDRTAVMFSSANSASKAVKSVSGTTVTLNSDGSIVNLRVGDLLGWPSSGGKNNGHVLIYVGGGYVIDVHGQGGNPSNPAISKRALDSYSRKNQIKFIIQAPNPATVPPPAETP